MDSGLESTSRLFSHDGSGNICYTCKFENSITFQMKSCTKFFKSQVAPSHLFDCTLCTGSDLKLIMKSRGFSNIC